MGLEMLVGGVDQLNFGFGDFLLMGIRESIRMGSTSHGAIGPLNVVHAGMQRES
jgi:hypothetical protein